MLSIGNKTFMNLQEAVGWLLENNALPFQSTANYAGGVEIAMSTLINPSPAKVRVGSIIFFADSKVSTVVGVTSNSFIVSDQYNDLVDDIVYVSNVAINASGHLIVTLSNDSIIDAGLIKQVSNFSIDGSQHLIVTYNDGSTTDLGAIFNGNINISGNLTVSGGISGSAITGNSIIENMSGYSALVIADIPNLDVSYIGAVKNGNKLTLSCAFSFVASATGFNSSTVARFLLPQDVLDKLYAHTIGNQPNVLTQCIIPLFTSISAKVDAYGFAYKGTGKIDLNLYATGLTVGQKYDGRFEVTFLLSDSLV